MAVRKTQSLSVERVGGSPSGARLLLVLVAHAAGGLDVEVTVQLVDQHQVDVEFAAVQLQTQVAQALHLQQRTLQGLHGGYLDTEEDNVPSHTRTHLSAAPHSSESSSFPSHHTVHLSPMWILLKIQNQHDGACQSTIGYALAMHI